MTSFRILAADIGGTNARFAEVEISGLNRISMSEPVVFPTGSDDIDSFDRLLDHYAANRPAGSKAIEAFDALSIAIAGAVNGQSGTLPNIAWDIDLSVSKPVRHTFLLNDFFAQAHGYLEPDVFERLHRVRPGHSPGPGSIVIVGAGTGLGHASLKPYKGQRVVIGSEAGHTSFSFHGKREREIETKMLGRIGKTWLTSDDVVSGSGAALIHESLTGTSQRPAQVLAEKMKNSPTCKYYSRFYARACRNYCLSLFPVEALVISGRVAARNPYLVESNAFFDEFNDARSYRHLMERIPIYLNQDELLGIKGAAIHAWLQLTNARHAPGP